jgi:rhamnosyltransferase
MAELSVLLLTKNGGRDLERLLRALYSQKCAVPFEVIAIDSGSTDGTLDLLQRFPVRLEHIPSETFHHARTRNFAASLASGGILIFLSQDAIPVSDTWLNTMISNFDDPKVGAAYGRQLPKPESSMERGDALATLYGGEKIVKDPAHRNGMGYRFYHFSDVNSAIRRSVWEMTRFPADLKIFEDLGIAKRILDAGWKIVYEPEAAVFHSHHFSATQLFKRYFDIGYTLKQLEIWDDPQARSSLLRDFRKLLHKQVSRVKNRSARARVHATVGQSFAKSAGLLLGVNQRFLPLALKRHLSAHRAFE